MFFKHQVHCSQLECVISVSFQKVSLFLGAIFLQCRESEAKGGRGHGLQNRLYPFLGSHRETETTAELP